MYLCACLHVHVYFFPQHFCTYACMCMREWFHALNNPHHSWVLPTINYCQKSKCVCSYMNKRNNACTMVSLITSHLLSKSSFSNSEVEFYSPMLSQPLGSPFSRGNLYSPIHGQNLCSSILRFNVRQSPRKDDAKYSHVLYSRTILGILHNICHRLNHILLRWAISLIYLIGAFT